MTARADIGVIGGTGLYALLNVVACLIVFLKLGWLSVASVFATYFLMSIMFPKYI